VNGARNVEELGQLGDADGVGLAIAPLHDGGADRAAHVRQRGVVHGELGFRP
jgi:hypothetical protein